MLKNFTVEKDGKKMELACRMPTFDEFGEIDRVYAAKIASLVREKGTKKLLLRAEVAQFLRENGIWTEKDEANINRLQNQIELCFKQLKRGSIKKSEVRRLCIEITDKRNEILNAYAKRSIIDEATIEAVADSEKIDYSIYISTVFNDGKQFWESFEDMKLEKNTEAYRKASDAVYECLLNIRPDYLKELPENKLLKKYGFFDENWNYVDPKTGEKVDKYGKKIEQKEDFTDISNGEIEPESPYLED